MAENFLAIRCHCKYCQQCKNDSWIYDECIGCYYGKHPHLYSIQYDFENYMKDIKDLSYHPDPKATDNNIKKTVIITCLWTVMIGSIIGFVAAVLWSILK